MGWFSIVLTRVGLGLDARIKAQLSLLMPELPIYFVIFPPFEKKLVLFFCFLFFFTLVGGSAVLRFARFWWFSSGAPVSVTFSFFGKSVSFFLVFFLFCFSSILVLLLCSWGVRKRGFLLFLFR